jgi:hypothetical protein
MQADARLRAPPPAARGRGRGSPRPSPGPPSPVPGRAGDCCQSARGAIRGWSESVPGPAAAPPRYRAPGKSPPCCNSGPWSVHRRRGDTPAAPLPAAAVAHPPPGSMRASAGRSRARSSARLRPTMPPPAISRRGGPSTRADAPSICSGRALMPSVPRSRPAPRAGPHSAPRGRRRSPGHRPLCVCRCPPGRGDTALVDADVQAGLHREGHPASSCRHSPPGR